MIGFGSQYKKGDQGNGKDTEEDGNGPGVTNAKVEYWNRIGNKDNTSHHAERDSTRSAPNDKEIQN